jgi:hypothetical protein
MNRQEHLEWCKQRALEYVERGELTNAVASMCSDLGKHKETKCEPFLAFAGMAEVERGRDAVKHWIEGFN